MAIGLADRSAENDVTPRKSDQFVVDDQNDGQISRDAALAQNARRENGGGLDLSFNEPEPAVGSRQTETPPRRSSGVMAP